MLTKSLRFLPLIILSGLILLLSKGLMENPKNLRSALIQQPLPPFHQQDLLAPDKQLDQTTLPRDFYLINIWGSWCDYCKKEWPFLMALAQQKVKIVGLNYRDQRKNAVKMLQQLGNPFLLNIYDFNGKVALTLGVNGTPETYLINPKGIVLLRYSGELTPQVWQQQFLPKITCDQTSAKEKPKC